ncbi:MAG: FAD-dependent oxidoreductase [Luteimonas sp.]
MRIAVVGSGIAGLASAWLLSHLHEVTLYEQSPRLGGHTDTHAVEVDGQQFAVDTGFIVHNPQHYPLLTQLFEALDVASRETTMGFSVQNQASGLEYNATSLGGLFCQRRNLVSPRFLGMVRDLLRFYREAPALLDSTDAGPSLGEYLQANDYGAAFRDDHLVPMASALWSAPPSSILAFPAAYLVRFMANHQMLQVADRPQWRTVVGGSSTYVHAMQARWSVRVHTDCTVRAVWRDAAGVAIHAGGDLQRFDQVVLACHSDQALRLLADADARETEVLGAMPYQDNAVVLHTDARLLPTRRKAWAAWNAFVPRDPGAPCTVSYCMNLLQGLQSREPIVVTLNRSEAIDPARVLVQRQYAHPVYTRASVAARARKSEIQGQRRTWFAGAYWGWGFHEDGMRSAVEVANALGVRWPAATP